MHGHDRINVDYVASLARLELDGDERKSLQTDMENILAYVELLREPDVSGIEATAHASLLHNVWRDDLASDSFPRSEMLANSPQTIDNELVKVASVLPGEEEQ